MDLKPAVLGPAILMLAACQGASTHTGGPVLFVDALGNRVVMDTAEPEPAPRPALPEISTALPEPGHAAPVVGTVPANRTEPGQTQEQKRQEPVPGLAASPPVTPGAWAGDVYTDSEEFDRRLAQQASRRFFQVPDGAGGRQTMLASQLGIADGSPPPVEPRPPRAPVILCRSTRPLPHLLPAQVDRVQAFAFPVYDPALSGQRYAGYAFSLPPDTREVSVWAVGTLEQAVDVAALLLGKEGEVVAVVNNLATESIPETLFRYGRVGATFTIPSGIDAGALAVVEGAWARRVLPATCPSGASPGQSLRGKVIVEFTKGPGAP